MDGRVQNGVRRSVVTDECKCESVCLAPPLEGPARVVGCRLTSVLSFFAPRVNNDVAEIRGIFLFSQGFNSKILSKKCIFVRRRRL